MGEILYPDFSKKKVIGDEGEYYGSGVEYGGLEDKHIKIFREFIESGNSGALMVILSNLPVLSTKNLEEIKKYTNDQLVDWLGKYKKERKIELAFFKVIFLELKARIDKARADKIRADEENVDKEVI